MFFVDTPLEIDYSCKFNRVLENWDAKHCYINSLLQCLTTFDFLFKNKKKENMTQNFEKLLLILKYLKKNNDLPNHDVERLKLELIKERKDIYDPFSTYLEIYDLFHYHTKNDKNLNLKKFSFLFCKNECHRNKCIKQYLDKEGSNSILINVKKDDQSLQDLINEDYFEKKDKTPRECRQCKEYLYRSYDIDNYSDFIVIRLERQDFNYHDNFPRSRGYYYSGQIRKKYFDVNISERVKLGEFDYKLVAIVLETDVHATAVVLNDFNQYILYDDYLKPREVDIKDLKNPYMIFLKKD